LHLVSQALVRIGDAVIHPSYRDNGLAVLKRQLTPFSVTLAFISRWPAFAIGASRFYRSVPNRIAKPSCL
jgi:hypothetical protein